MSEFLGPEGSERMARLPGEFLSTRELEAVMEQRFGFDQTDLQDLAAGKATVEKNSALDGVDRGMFAHSAEAFITAETDEDRGKAWQYLCNDAESQLFEAITYSGHIEEFRNAIEEDTGDALVLGDTSLGEVYLRDLMMPNFRWRAELSFAEFMNTAEVAELSRRGVLKDHVYIEASCYAYDVPIEQAGQVGYRAENEKAYLRMQTDEDSERVLQTLSYSYLRPQEVSRLAGLLDVRLPEATSTKEALKQGILIPKEIFETLGGLAGLAGLVDGIKERQTGQPAYFGNKVEETPALDAYDNILELSRQRKERAREVSGQYVQDVLLSYMAFRNGMIDMKTAFKQMGQALVTARSLVLMADRDLAVEQHGEDIASQIDVIRSLYSEGRLVEAMEAEQSLTKALGTIYVCGLSVQIDVEGNMIGADGAPIDCKELKNGDTGVCPGCKHLVNIIVDPNNKEKLYCPRQSCSLSYSGGREVKYTKRENASHDTPSTIASVILASLKNEQFATVA